MSTEMFDVVVGGGGVLAGAQRSGGERSEPERSVAPAKTPAGLEGAAPPDPEVRERRGRRRFSAVYKAQIVRQAAACRTSGEVGALLRREGLYHSHLSKWRAVGGRGAIRALTDDTRGRKATLNPLDAEVQQLRRQNARLERRLKQAEAIIDIQKKVSEILGIPLAGIDDAEGDS